MAGRWKTRSDSHAANCASWIFRPEVEGTVPCVVMGSGLSCVLDQGLDTFAGLFAQAGIAAVGFDYRCFGDSGGEPRGLLNARRQREDFVSAVTFAGSLDGVDPDRIAIWGYSLGGGHAQAVAMEDARVKAAICVAPVVSGLGSLMHIGGPLHPLRLAGPGVRDRLRAWRGAEPHRIAATGSPGSVAVINSPEAAGGFASITPPGSSWRNEVCARAVLTPPYHLARKAREIPCPILYCVTEQDDVNPPALGIKAARRAPQGELRLYPGGHFDPFLGETLEQMAADQIEFLRRVL